VAQPLVVQDLCKAFGAFRAVDGVNLEIGAGRVHSLIGPNGAGKTTTFNCISGFLRPSGGQVLLGGRDVTGWPPHRLVAGGLARTFQITKVFGELPVAENLALAARSRAGLNLNMWRRARSAAVADRESEEILDLVGLADQAALRADQLGHGDKRVLEVAIALVLRPTVLLLDEPTAGMSTAETARITTLVRSLVNRTSVLLVEHDIEMVLAISDEITVMTRGRVIAHGTPDAIVRDAGVQEAYLGATEASFW